MGINNYAGVELNAQKIYLKGGFLSESGTANWFTGKNNSWSEICNEHIPIVNVFKWKHTPYHLLLNYWVTLIRNRNKIRWCNKNNVYQKLQQTNDI